LFGYAWKLCLVVSVAPLALAIVLFPRFAETHQSLPGEEFRGICMRAMRMALFIAIPLACLLYALRSQVVVLLFERGAFSAEASETVARLFGLLVIGAPSAVALAYMEKITYAAQNTWIPACYQLATALLLTLFAPVLTVSSGADRWPRRVLRSFLRRRAGMGDPGGYRGARLPVLARKKYCKQVTRFCPRPDLGCRPSWLTLSR